MGILSAEEAVKQVIVRSGKITDFKIIYILYYAQLESLKKHGTPLFEDKFEFRKSGPCPIEAVKFMERLGRSGVYVDTGSLGTINKIENKILDNVISHLKPIKCIDLFNKWQNLVTDSGMLSVILAPNQRLTHN